MTSPRLTVLVIGGYGTFGARLCELLADEPRLTLIVAGRSLEKAEAFCRWPSRAKLVPARIDRAASLGPDVATLAPDIVVDASGPFQEYGADPYAVPRAALAAGADYLDFADGSEFALGIGALDEAAQKAGRFVLSGVSSLPVLSAAAVRVLAADLSRVDAIVAGIAPSPHAVLGGSITRAIASYAGKPIRLVRNGRVDRGYGLVDSVRHTVMVPGCVPLGPIRYSLVDVPDLTTLPLAWPSVRDVWVGAGPTPAILHLALSSLAILVKLRLLPSLLPFVGPMNWSVSHFRWGEHRSGMFVEVAGLDRAGQAVTNRWHLLAEGDRGPYIPSMAVEILVRGCLDGNRPLPGARIAGGEVELADFEPRFRDRGIVTATLRGPGDATIPLYRQLLGPAYWRMARPLQQAHDVRNRVVLRGSAAVTRGRGLLARMVGAVVGFPPEGAAVPVTVTLSRDGSQEIWIRDFGGHRFTSTQHLGTGRNEGMLVERFGVVAFAMAVVIDEGKLSLIQRKWTFLGMRMPRWMLPTGSVYEHDADGRFNFHVEVRIPLLGPVVFYRGWLEPASG